MVGLFIKHKLYCFWSSHAIEAGSAIDIPVHFWVIIIFSHYLLVNVILYVRQTYCKAWHYSPSLEPGIIYVLNFIIPVGIMWFEFGNSKKTVWKLSPRSRISNGGRWQQQLIAYSGANFTFEGCRTTSNFKNRIYFLAVGVKSRVRSSGVKLPWRYSS